MATPEDVQDRLYREREEIAATPALLNGGLVLGVLDPDDWGWDRVSARVDEDGFIAFTNAPRAERLAQIGRHFGEGFEIPYWDMFEGRPDVVMATCRRISEDRALSPGWRVSSALAPSPEIRSAVAALNRSCGVAPLPDWYLAGEGPPNVTTWMTNETGEVVAAACGSKRYHADSAFAGGLYCGSVSVSPDMHRRGLGALVSAHLLIDSQSLVGWSRAIAIARIENHASCGMLEKCGLVHDPGRATLILNASGGFRTK